MKVLYEVFQFIFFDPLYYITFEDIRWKKANFSMFVEHHELIKLYTYESLLLRVSFSDEISWSFSESFRVIHTQNIHFRDVFFLWFRSSFPHKPLVQFSPICWLADSYVFIRERVGYVCDKSRRTHRRRLIRVVGEPNHAKAVILHTRSLSEHTITGAFLRFYQRSWMVLWAQRLFPWDSW